MSKKTTKKKRVKVLIRFYKFIVKKYLRIVAHLIRVRYKFIKILRRKFIKILLKFIFRLWIKEVNNIERLDLKNPCFIASNHCSYLDFCFLEALVDQRAFFWGAEKLKTEPFPVPWLIRYSKTIYVDRKNPSIKSFKDALYVLRKHKTSLITFPEGTRSRTGKLQEPKLGFMDLVLMAGVPVIPVGIKGSYDILPPGKKLPRFKRCTINIGEKIYLNKSNPELQLLLSDKAEIDKYSKEVKQKLAKYIMKKIAELL